MLACHVISLSLSHSLELVTNSQDSSIKIGDHETLKSRTLMTIKTLLHLANPYISYNSI